MVNKLIIFYNNLYQKGIDEFPISNMIINKCSIKRVSKQNLDGDYKYHCFFKGNIYSTEASCNLELLQFVETITDE
jgi:hypothetical protein|tara:strand:- start:926 stop:1153 length:228 start_codon:yes stop_codon:yes gene_type:complete